MGALKIKEKTIEKSILAYLKAHGFVVFKVESQGTWDASKGIYRKKSSINSSVGVADIVGCIDGGRFLAIEVKSATGRLTEHQKNFLKQIEEKGGIAIVARSIDDVRERLGL